MIKAANVCKNYTDNPILKDISLEIQAGEIVSIVGASGAGKSTLLHLLGSLDKPTSGNIYIDNTDITKLNDTDLSNFRNQYLGFIFQFHQLLPEFTVLENVCLPAWIAGKDKETTTKKAKELLDYLRLSHRSQHQPAQLSGGEQQRTAVARALINQPKIVFADEPSGNLDSQNAQELHQLFFQLREQFHQTFVIVTHNEVLAAASDRVITMKDGRIRG